MKRCIVILIVLVTGCAAPEQALNPQVPRTIALHKHTGFTVLHSFGGTDGAHPMSDVLFYKGSLYGTTAGGGKTGDGTIFEMSLDGNERVLHSFGDAKDGADPVAGLTNVDGTLYGTTTNGGNGCGTYGCGTIFSISARDAKFKTLYTFTGQSDGEHPSSDLKLFNGTLYGTTSGTGGYCSVAYGGCGTVFSFTPSRGFKTLYDFQGTPDGEYPSGSLAKIDGELYGTTIYGGYLGGRCPNSNLGCGTVFSITLAGTESIVHAFKGDGDDPWGGVTLLKGVMYGTTLAGGDREHGTAFKLTREGRLTTIYDFGGQDRARTGWAPKAPLIVIGDALYGSDDNGGGGQDRSRAHGTAFKLELGRTVMGTALYQFRGGADGGKPVAAMTYVNGELYGTLPDSGADNDGLLFRLKP